jgi:23S rRNA U2552 (ribose-2'-O)-methylase RlmE/FtsJ
MRTFNVDQVVEQVAVALGGLVTRATTTPGVNREILNAVRRQLLQPERTGRDARESRVEDYRQMAHPVGRVTFGSCPGVDRARPDPQATMETAKATLSAEDVSAGDWRHIAHNDPFYHYILSTQPFRRLVNIKDVFSTNERAWQMRDLPSLSFVGQFYFCMREMNEACGGYFERPDRCRNFIDIGCAPGGFLQCLLDFDPTRRGIGLTLATDTSKGHASGAHEMDMTLMDILDQTPRFKLLFQDVTDRPLHLHYGVDGALLGEGAAPQFDLAIAGARFSGKGSGEADDAERGGDRAQEKLITAQLLVALQNLQPGGDLVVVLNVTPLAMNMQPICFLRSCFSRLVALKPKSNFKYRSSFYMTCFGYDPKKLHRNEVSPLAASLAVQHTLKATFDRLMKGEDRDECNAPVGDADNAALCREQGTMLHQLLSPLWKVQHDAIHELLERASGGGGGGSGDGGARSGGSGWGR